MEKLEINFNDAEFDYVRYTNMRDFSMLMGNVNFFLGEEPNDIYLYENAKLYLTEKGLPIEWAEDFKPKNVEQIELRNEAP